VSRRHDTDAPRGLGVISSVHPRDDGKGFLFATDAQNTEIFMHVSACRPQELFYDLQRGDKVSFSISEAPKGLRGHDVRRMTESEEEQYRTQQREYQATITERRGNHGNTEEHGTRTSFVDLPTFDNDEDLERRRRRQRK